MCLDISVIKYLELRTSLNGKNITHQVQNSTTKL